MMLFLQVEELSLALLGLIVAVATLWKARVPPINRLSRTSMIAGAFGLFICSKFAVHAEALTDQLFLLGVAVVMGSVSVAGWRDGRTGMGKGVLAVD